jgi:peroxiredoxin
MRISCPECDAVLKSADDLPAGKVIRCPKCECSFRVPGAPPRKAARADDEDDEEYETRRPRARRPGARQSTGMVLILSIVGGCVAVFAVVIVLAFFVWNKYLREDDKDVVGGKNTKIVGRSGQPFGAGGPNPVGTAPQVGRPAPEIEGTDSSGKKVKLTDFRGKVVVLAFWAGRDKNSAESLKHLRELKQRLADRKFVLLGVNQDEKMDEFKKAERDNQINWPSLHDGPKGTISQEWSVNRLPAIFVIDPAGVLRYRNVDSDSLDKAVELLLRDT